MPRLGWEDAFFFRDDAIPVGRKRGAYAYEAREALHAAHMARGVGVPACGGLVSFQELQKQGNTILRNARAFVFHASFTTLTTNCRMIDNGMPLLVFTSLGKAL